MSGAHCPGHIVTPNPTHVSKLSQVTQNKISKSNFVNNVIKGRVILLNTGSPRFHRFSLHLKCGFSCFNWSVP